MKIYTFTPNDYFGSNMYLLDFQGKGIIIDPSVAYPKVKDFLFQQEITVEYIIITHAHFDHFCEIDSWCENTAAEVVVGYEDAKALSDPYYNCYKVFLNADKGYFGKYRTVCDGDTINISDTQISVIHTPGHSKGSISLKISDNIFVGDVVFAGNSMGRCDLPGGDYKTLISSINKIMSHSGQTLLYPGHGKSVKIEEIKRFYI